MGNFGSGLARSETFQPLLPAKRGPLREYYTVVLGLAQGSKRNRRPPLPEELVILICSFANFICLNLEYSREENRDTDVSSDGPIASETWLRSPPLTLQIINEIHSIQLLTESCHQGWVSDPNSGSWSWFDITLCRGDEGPGQLIPKTLDDGSPASWESHSHAVEMHGYTINEGKRFGIEHPLWNYVEPGDVLTVEAKAQFPGWQNRVRRGVLLVYTWWKPSSAMLSSIYSR
ncbi:hypothetical protein RhiJN_16176 [Ceratobasidium sp. AG-Ba]|nr:hypothetical protein RhiJN_16176 [Ceratobasidium sp. AG-Ba]